jgi:hypothetical protein
MKPAVPVIRKRMKLPGGGAAQAEPPVQAFFQAFPNPSLFPPRISKEFFGGFV